MIDSFIIKVKAPGNYPEAFTVIIYTSIFSEYRKFHPMLPVWGATQVDAGLLILVLISIHAPHVGSDAAGAFSPQTVQRFQSTLPVWGATFEYAA